MNQDQVREFHKFFGQPARTTPTFISPQETMLRRNLLYEETSEADEAMADGIDLQHIAKELADVMYVAYGAALHYGIDLDRVFDEVAASNLTKLWDCVSCNGTGSRLSVSNFDDDGTPLGGLMGPCEYCDASGKVKKVREDGKVLKPPTYSPPDLSFIPNKQRMATIDEH